MLTCAHPAWKSTSAPLFFRTSGQETVENLKISRGQLAPCQENRIKRQQTVSSAGCKVLAPNAGFLLALMSSYCHFRPIVLYHSQAVSVSLPQDKIRGSATGDTDFPPGFSRRAAGTASRRRDTSAVAASSAVYAYAALADVSSPVELPRGGGGCARRRRWRTTTGAAPGGEGDSQWRG